MKPTHVRKCHCVERRSTRGWRSSHGRPHHESDRCACCEIPERQCPPSCAALVKWHIERGAAARAFVVVRNVARVSRQFQFAVSAISGLGVGTANLELSPATALLQPGKSVTLQIDLKDSASLRAAQDYRAELTVRGAWEQCVAIECHVGPDPFASIGVEQGNLFQDKWLRACMAKRSIAWRIDRGVTPHGAITVHNMGRMSQSFHLETNPLTGSGAGGGTVVVSPTSFDLGAGQSGVAKIQVDNSALLEPCQTYTSTVVVHGYYAQHVPIRCWVEADVTVRTQIEQGDVPVRVRAHHWYDHFQCTEPCVVGIV